MGKKIGNFIIYTPHSRFTLIKVIIFQFLIIFAISGITYMYYDFMEGYVEFAIAIEHERYYLMLHEETSSILEDERTPGNYRWWMKTYFFEDYESIRGLEIDAFIQRHKPKLLENCNKIRENKYFIVDWVIFELYWRRYLSLLLCKVFPSRFSEWYRGLIFMYIQNVMERVRDKWMWDYRKTYIRERRRVDREAYNKKWPFLIEKLIQDIITFLWGKKK